MLSESSGIVPNLKHIERVIMEKLRLRIGINDNGEGSVCFTTLEGSEEDEIMELEEGEEELVGFIPLTSDDSGIRAFVAVGDLAIDANRSMKGDAALELLLAQIFDAGVGAGMRKAKGLRISPL